MDPPRKSLELDEDLVFQRREWRFQSVGWIVWILLLVAAAAGLMGSGPLSKARQLASDGSIDVSYDRFVHHHHPTQMEIYVQRRPTPNGPLELKIGQEFLDAIEIERIHPEPVTSSIDEDGTVFRFQMNDEAQTGKICIYYDYESFGSISSVLHLVGHAPIQFSQFIFP